MAPPLAGTPLARAAQLGKLGATATAVLVGVLTLLALALTPLVRLAGSAVAVDVAAEVVELPPLVEPSTILAADGSPLARADGDVNRHKVPLDDLPRHVPEAVLAAEDQGFRAHAGYHLPGLARAAHHAVRSREEIPSGSTITEQVARANFVGDELTLRRRVEELAYAVALEDALSKDEILERYLNEVHFGAGAYGIQAAGREFFGRDAVDLSVGQAALLAALISSPATLDPRQEPRAAALQRDSVLAAMAEQSYLSDARAEDLADRPVEVAGPPTDEVAEPWLVEAVRREFAANPAFGETEDERTALLGAGGLAVRTTIDAEAQGAARQVMEAALDGEEAPGALVALDPRNGSVRAWHANGSARSASEGVGRLRRQPGTAFAPVVLAAALEEGMAIDQGAEGASTAAVEPAQESTGESGAVGQGSPGLAEALVQGVDSAFATLALDVGPDPIADLSGRLGIDTLAALGSDPGPEIALGALHGGVTPAEMATAYGTLAQRGRYAAPVLVERVEDGHGTTLYTASREPEQRVRPTVAARTTAVLQEVVRMGTGTSAQIDGWEPAGQSGGSQEHADEWFVGSVPGLTAAVWVGRPDDRPASSEATGESAPPLWADFMTRALEHREPVGFPDPADATGPTAADS